jgi:hypothetical protein
MKQMLSTFIVTVCLSLICQASAWAQCVDLEAPAVEVAFDEEVKAEEDVVYLSLIGGDTPVPNECGLNPSNPSGEWVGWGGPLNFDNASIGEGGATRNFITIAGVRYERGIGTHALARLVYDLTGGKYTKFMGVAGVDDEKTCGTVQIVFSIDDEEVYDTGVLNHSDPEGHEIEFDIPLSAKELLIDIQNGGDNIDCDHADIGAARLLGTGVAVSSSGSLTTTWGDLKSRL